MSIAMLLCEDQKLICPYKLLFVYMSSMFVEKSVSKKCESDVFHGLLEKWIEFDANPGSSKDKFSSVEGTSPGMVTDRSNSELHMCKCLWLETLET